MSKTTLLNTRQAAAFLGLSDDVLRARVKRKNGPAPADNQKPIRYCPRELKKYLESYKPRYSGGPRPRGETYIALTIRIPASFHAKIAEAAKAEKRSIASQFEQLLGKLL